MSQPSNLYAEKVYSEHPTVMWALDDQADYITLITEAQRDIRTGWTVTGASVTSGSAITTEPFQDSFTTLVEGSTSTTTVTLISPDLVNFQDMNSELGSLSVGTYFYSNSPYLTSVQVGIRYIDTTTSLPVEDLETFATSIYQYRCIISN